MELDESRLPLAHVRFLGKASQADADDYVAFMTDCFSAERKVGILLEMVDVGMPPLGVIKGMGHWLKDNEDAFGRYVVCLAVVTKSAVTRGAVRFVNTLAPPVYTQRVFAEVPDAEAWVVEMLAAAGLTVPPS